MKKDPEKMVPIKKDPNVRFPRFSVRVILERALNIFRCVCGIVEWDQ